MHVHEMNFFGHYIHGSSSNHRWLSIYVVFGSFYNTSSFHVLQLRISITAQPFPCTAFTYWPMEMDKTAAPDTQLIPQLQDTNIQINRLMVQQLNRLNDTIKQPQLTDDANFRQEPSIHSRTQQLQALLPIVKTALEHQQTFYHRSSMPQTTSHTQHPAAPSSTTRHQLGQIQATTLHCKF